MHLTTASVQPRYFCLWPVGLWLKDTQFLLLLFCLVFWIMQCIFLLIGQKIILKEKLADFHNFKKQETETQPNKTTDTDLNKMDTEEMQKNIAVDGTMTHMVIKGDTMFNICKRFGITVDQLKEWNNLENITIQIGQKLIVSP